MSNFYNRNNNHNHFNRNNNHGNFNRNSNPDFDNKPVKVDSNVSYINPYNFISLNKSGCKRYDALERDGSLTGYIECELTTKTETIVPDTENVDKEKPEFKFYNYRETKNGFTVPVIPGSEIRGMLRSDFEVFTDSCLSTVDGKKSFSDESKKHSRSLNELLNVAKDLNKSYSPCIDKKSLCEACNLFGFVADENAKGSKIRISDALYEGDTNPYAEYRVLSDLASPHISNATFYSLFLSNADLANMDEGYWNYLYQYTSKGKEQINLPNITIRGRKMYWHHKPIVKKDLILKPKRNCAITPVKEGTKFKFKVYFENITNRDLEHLIAVINLDYDSDFMYKNKKYYDLCHKIGKAKPLGYGSIKLDVKDVQVRKVEVKDGKVSYQMLPGSEVLGKDLKDINLNTSFDTNTQSFKDALKMYNFNYLDANYERVPVNYPQGQPEGKKETGFFWFNFNSGENKETNSKYFLMVLPLVSEGRDIANNYPGLKATIKRDGVEVPIDGLKIPKYNK